MLKATIKLSVYAGLYSEKIPFQERHLTEFQTRHLYAASYISTKVQDLSFKVNKM